MVRRVWRCLSVILLFSATPASAQGLPPVEFGIALGQLLQVGPYNEFSIGSDRRAGDLRVTFPFSPRFSLEGLITVSGESYGPFAGTEGLYIAQVKQRLQGTARSGFHAFVTYGAAGHFEHFRQKEADVVSPDGQLLHLKKQSFGHIDAPMWTVVGGGVQQTLARHLAIRLDAQLVTILFLPVAARLSAGVSIPLGRYPGPRPANLMGFPRAPRALPFDTLRASRACRGRR